MKITKAIALLLALGAGATGAKELAIGLVAPLSGPAAVYGKEASEAASAYIDHVNKTGGVNGNKLRLVIRDDGFKPADTVAHVRQLIEQEKVVAFISGAGAASWESVVKAGLLQQHDVPVVGVITAATFLRGQEYRNLFFLRPTVHAEIQRIMGQLKSMGFARIAVIYQDDSFGKDAVQGVRTEGERLKLQPIAFAGHRRDASDVEVVVRGALEARPDALVILGASNSAALAVKTARQAGFNGQIIGMSVIDPRNVVNAVGAENARGMGLIQVMPNPRSPLMPVSQEFRHHLAASRKDGTALSTIAMEGFVAAKVIVEAIRRAGRSPGPQDIYRVLTTSGAFDAGGFSVRFDATNRTGSVFADVAIIDIRGVLLY
jgi:branched-chain amino acid transport system substrate-binding protein